LREKGESFTTSTDNLGETVIRALERNPTGLKYRVSPKEGMAWV